MEWVVIIAVVIAVFVAMGVYANKRRRAELMAKYGEPQIVDLIMAKKIWQGMTAEMLFDSWGRPADMDERVFKSKVSRTYKYNQTGRNQFRDRVKTENGIVVGWKQR